MKKITMLTVLVVMFSFVGTAIAGVTQQELLENFAGRIQDIEFIFSPAGDTEFQSQYYHYYKDDDGVFQPSNDGKWGPLAIGRWKVTATAHDENWRVLFAPHTQYIEIQEGMTTSFAAPNFVLGDEYRYNFMIEGLSPETSYKVRAIDDNGNIIDSYWSYSSDEGEAYADAMLPLDWESATLVILRDDNIIGTADVGLDPFNAGDIDLSFGDFTPPTCPAGHGYAEMEGEPTFNVDGLSAYIAVALSADTPPSNNFWAGQEDIAFTRFSIASEEMVRVTGIQLGGQGLFTDDDLRDIKIVNLATGIVEAGPIDSIVNGYLNCDFNILAYTSEKYEVRADINQGGHSVAITVSDIIAEDMDGNAVSRTGLPIQGNIMGLIK